jgi:hypothetical protein
MAILKDNHDEKGNSKTASNPILMETTHHDLDEIIDKMIESTNNSTENTDEKYKKINKINQLKTLIQLSMQLVGKTYGELLNDEIEALEMEANRSLNLLSSNNGGLKEIEIIEDDDDEDGLCKILTNTNLKIDPEEFLRIYTSKLVNYAENSTGLKVLLSYFPISKYRY